MKNTKSLYHGHRFPPEIISHAVWLYHRFCLSFRDVEELLAEPGIEVSYESIRQSISARATFDASEPLSRVSLESVFRVATGYVRVKEAKSGYLVYNLAGVF
jgi:transposase-like protein